MRASPAPDASEGTHFVPENKMGTKGIFGTGHTLQHVVPRGSVNHDGGRGGGAYPSSTSFTFAASCLSVNGLGRKWIDSVFSSARLNASSA